MRLYASAASPYVRKVRVVADEVGLAERIELVPIDVWDEAAGVRRHNPLAKIPALQVDDGLTLFDSRVICEFLDATSVGPKVIPTAGDARWRALRWQAMADGILDASVSARLENVFRAPEARSQQWIDRQNLAVEAALDQLESEWAAAGEQPAIGEIAVGCALGYRDFRFAETDWRATRPRLADWFGTFRERASMRETAPTG